MSAPEGEGCGTGTLPQAGVVGGPGRPAAGAEDGGSPLRPCPPGVRLDEGTLIETHTRRLREQQFPDLLKVIALQERLSYSVTEEARRQARSPGRQEFARPQRRGCLPVLWLQRRDNRADFSLTKHETSSSRE